VLTAIVENVDGWYSSPVVEGRDAALVLADGAAWGPKTMQAREVVVTGAIAGPADRLANWRDDLAARAVARVPADLTIIDRYARRTLTATVRCGTDQFRHTFIAGNAAFRYQLTLTAADPRLYDGWQSATLLTGGGGGTGRVYPRTYPWRYGSPYTPNSAWLANAGNVDAPAIARYDGQLTDSRLTDGQNVIYMAPLDPGEQIWVATESLDAQAAGGAPRASYVLPGSRPLMIPRGGARWFLYAAGAGSVTISWRSAWA
jgi:hypothetical protein